MGCSLYPCSIQICIRVSWVLTGFYSNCDVGSKATLHLLTDDSSACSQTTDFEELASCLPVCRDVMFPFITKENNKTM